MNKSILYIALVMGFFACKKDDTTAVDYRDKYIGTYKGGAYYSPNTYWTNSTIYVSKDPIDNTKIMICDSVLADNMYFSVHISDEGIISNEEYWRNDTLTVFKRREDGYATAWYFYFTKQ